nr:hypothetical protein [Gammaproteobacteria bacterium]NIX57966.1 hypothetical protein [candidate division Zixibacteria bacterium]
MDTLKAKLVSSHEANKLPQELDRIKSLASQYILTKPNHAVKATKETIKWLSSIRTNKDEYEQELSDLLMIQGDAYCTIGDFHQGLHAYQMSLKLIEKTIPMERIGDQLKKIGAVQSY